MENYNRIFDYNLSFSFNKKKQRYELLSNAKNILAFMYKKKKHFGISIINMQVFEAVIADRIINFIPETKNFGFIIKVRDIKSQTDIATIKWQATKDVTLKLKNGKEFYYNGYRLNKLKLYELNFKNQALIISNSLISNIKKRWSITYFPLDSIEDSISFILIACYLLLILPPPNEGELFYG